MTATGNTLKWFKGSTVWGIRLPTNSVVSYEGL